MEIEGIAGSIELLDLLKVCTDIFLQLDPVCFIYHMNLLATQRIKYFGNIQNCLWDHYEDHTAEGGV
jgi:hypothetical protein